MRILFATLAANTHMFNMVPLAWALRAAGHEVCVASGPELIPDTTKAGLMAVAVGPQVDMVEDARQAEYGDTVHGSEYDITEMSPERLTWDYARNVLRVWSQGPVAAFDYLANDPTVDDLVRFSRYWKPDLVVWDATTYAGAIAARVVGAAQVRLLFGLDQVARIHQIFADGLAAQPGEAEDPLVEMITRKLARHDATFDPSLVFGQLTLDPQPDWMRLSHEDSIAYHAVSPTPYNGPSVMPDWLAEPAGRRQICVTLGLSLREIDDHWGEGIKHSTLFEAVDGLDVDVIATASTEDLEGVSIPGNVKVHDFVPMTALLPHMSAIVHHGGGGTRMNAVTYGVPQVIIPGWSWDEEIWAAKLAERGAGVVIRQEELTAAKLRAALVQVLETPSFAAAATDVQKQAQACPTPADTVRVLEDLVRRHRTAR